MPASAFTWTATLFHCPSGLGCHTHPIQSFTGVTSGSFPAVDHDYPSYVELTLTVTDSGGLTDTKTVDLYPKTVDLSFATVPTGLQIVVNSVQSTAPFTTTKILGSTNTISAVTPQTLNGTTYVFASWSDGGAASHNISANQAVTYTATYTSQTAAYRDSVLADSPAAYWRLGEPSGTTAADASGNNRTGSYVGSPTLGVGGALVGDSNTAVSFNGSSQYVEVPYAAALNPSTWARLSRFFSA